MLGKFEPALILRYIFVFALTPERGRRPDTDLYIASPQTGRPGICFPKLPAMEITAKLLLVAASSLANRAAIPRFELAAI